MGDKLLCQLVSCKLLHIFFSVYNYFCYLSVNKDEYNSKLQTYEVFCDLWSYNS